MLSKRIISQLVLLSLVTILLTGCWGQSYSASSEERAKLAESSNGSDEDILIGVAWPMENSRMPFIWGAQLAEEEINLAGGLGGRHVKLVIKDEAKYREAAHINTDKQTRSSYQQAASSLAREFASDPRIIAVIGHHSSLLAIPAATTYYYHGVLYIASTSTNPGLIISEDDLTFQLLPNDREMVRQLVGYAALNTDNGKQPYKRIVILNERSKYGDDAASFFTEAATEFGVKIVSRNSFYKRKPGQTFIDYRSYLFPLRSLDFDAIFLVASKTEAGEIVRQAVEVDIRKPFLGMDVMENSEFLKAAGEAAEGTIVPSAYNENFNLAQPVIEAYREKHGIEPDTWAALAYDSIKLIAHGIELSNYSTIPSFVANSIRYMDPWFGATGVYKFKLDGSNLGKAYIIKQVKEATFRSLSGGQVPFLLYLHANNKRAAKVSANTTTSKMGGLSNATITEKVEEIAAAEPSLFNDFKPEMLLFNSSQATAETVVTKTELPDLILNYIDVPEKLIVPTVIVPFKPPNNEDSSNTAEPKAAAEPETAATTDTIDTTEADTMDNINTADTMATTPTTAPLDLVTIDEIAEPNTFQTITVLPIRADMIPSDSLSGSRLQQSSP